MTAFSLHQQLRADCHVLGELDACSLLLFDASSIPWFIVVPHVHVCELHELSQTEQVALMGVLNVLSLFVKQHFACDKLNTAAIGNKVSQLHVHVIGRREDDLCWPEVVWGRVSAQAYAQTAVTDIQAHLIRALPDRFVPTALANT